MTPAANVTGAQHHPQLPPHGLGIILSAPHSKIQPLRNGVGVKGGRRGLVKSGSASVQQGHR